MRVMHDKETSFDLKLSLVEALEKESSKASWYTPIWPRFDAWVVLGGERGENRPCWILEGCDVTSVYNGHVTCQIKYCGRSQ